MVNRIEQAIVATQAAIEPSQGVTQLAFFNEDGTPFDFGNPDLSPAAAQADSTADVIGEIVTDFNALLAKLRAAGLLAE